MIGAAFRECWHGRFVCKRCNFISLSKDRHAVFAVCEMWQFNCLIGGLRAFQSSLFHLQPFGKKVFLEQFLCFRDSCQLCKMAGSGPPEVSFGFETETPKCHCRHGFQLAELASKSRAQLTDTIRPERCCIGPRKGFARTAKGAPQRHGFQPLSPLSSIRGPQKKGVWVPSEPVPSSM